MFVEGRKEAFGCLQSCFRLPVNSSLSICVWTSESSEKEYILKHKVRRRPVQICLELKAPAIICMNCVAGYARIAYL
jgi:hypothetical protein